MSDQGAPVDFYYWTTGEHRTLPPARRAPNAVANFSPTMQTGGSDYKVSGSSIEASLCAQSDWHFEHVGEGAATFTVRNAGGGLVIVLSSWNQDDSSGYFVVLDDDNHESYVLALRSLGANRLIGDMVSGAQRGRGRSYQRMPNVSVDPNFRLSPDRSLPLYVLYQAGAIMVGTGTDPGRNPILYMPVQPQSSGTALHQYGFARLGTRWPHPIRIMDVQNMRNNTNYRMPPNPLGPGSSFRVPRVETSKLLYQGTTFSDVGGRTDKSGETPAPFTLGNRMPSLLGSAGAGAGRYAK